MKKKTFYVEEGDYTFGMNEDDETLRGLYVEAVYVWEKNNVPSKPENGGYAHGKACCYFRHPVSGLIQEIALYDLSEIHYDGKWYSDFAKCLAFLK